MYVIHKYNNFTNLSARRRCWAKRCSFESARSINIMRTLIFQMPIIMAPSYIILGIFLYFPEVYNLG